MRSGLGLAALVGLSGCYVQTGYAYRTRPAYAYSAEPAAAQPAYAQPAGAQPVAAQPTYASAPSQCACRQGAQEICNGCDDNCNGAIDEACVQPPCVCRQGAQEICNGCDDNCNGAIDEACVR